MREAKSGGSINVNNPAWQLFTFTDAIWRSAKIEDVYEAALDAIHGATGCDRAAIMFGAAGDALEVVASRGLPDVFLAALKVSSARRTISETAPVYIENVADSDFPEPFKTAASSAGVQSLGVIPVVAGGVIRGLFALCLSSPRAFAQGEQTFALAIARQLGFSLERLAAEAEGRRAEEKLLYLAAMVESSDDAIVTKDLNGVITSWNSGAERLFGFSAQEAIGQPITIIIPEERHEEEWAILAKLRNGQRIDHFETIRRSRAGTLLDISLTVSPVKDASGNVIGASKIARDISERRKAMQQQDLLLREMHHRVRNLFALASTIVSMTARRSQTVEQLSESACRRLRAMAAAQSLTMRPLAPEQKFTSLRALLDAVLKPFTAPSGEMGAPISVEGCDAELSNRAATALALVIHELATNAMKYGGLGRNGNGVVIACEDREGGMQICWREPGVTRRSNATEGFGEQLIAATIEHQLNGRFKRIWDEAGLDVAIEIKRDKLREA
jgi:PAS domain S-box-containing protein